MTKDTENAIKGKEAQIAKLASKKEKNDKRLEEINNALAENIDKIPNELKLGGYIDYELEISSEKGVILNAKLKQEDLVACLYIAANHIKKIEDHSRGIGKGAYSKHEKHNITMTRIGLTKATVALSEQAYREASIQYLINQGIIKDKLPTD